MSWLQQLYDTYEACSQVAEFVSGDNPLLPICHTTQNAHIEVVINQKGEFLRAKVLEKNDLLTVVPCTEGSAGRSGSKPVHHPLCDKLQYVAGDYVTFGGTVTVGYSKNPQEPYQNYLNDLSEWVESDDTHPKIQAIYNYIKQGRLIADLVKAQCLYLNTQGQLIKQWEKKPDSKEDAPAIFKIMPAGQTIEASFVRWIVEIQGEREPRAWQDVGLRKAWISFYSKRDAIQGLCMITGKTSPLASQHPSGIRHGADKAKLISSNDSSGYTFRGRFTDNEGSQACTVSSEVSQKAHNALRWLVQRKQAYRLGDQAFIVWAKAGETLPNPLENTHDEFDIGGDDDFEEISVGDVGQAYADRLRKKIAGYSVYIGDTQRILLMGVDSATPGRMAITFYRELTKSEFFKRLEAWHQNFAWFQCYNQNSNFIGAPSPKDIAEAAYGRRLDENLKKATVARLLPCIVDQVSFPPDLVRSIVNRASNKSAFPSSDMWEWDKVLGIACALVRGTHKEEMKMGLDEERTTRDYLYGRLLAVADNIERRALEYSKEKRDTNAGRLMQRFSTHPFETWKNIELALKPYIDRLRVNGDDDFLGWNEYLLRHIMLKFEPNEFTKPNTPLSSEFLLAFHSQRTRSFSKKTDPIKSQEPTNITDESDD